MLRRMTDMKDLAEQLTSTQAITGCVPYKRHAILGTSTVIYRFRSFFLQENAMKKLTSAAMFILFFVVSAAALAEIKTVTLSVSGMT